jgi:hypothetical protein
MSGATDVESLIYACRQAHRSGDRIYLNLRDTARIFPNGAVPMAVALEFFKRVGLTVSTSEVSENVVRANFLNPRGATNDALDSSGIKNIIWRYTDEREANALSNAFVTQLEENVECGPGLLDALNWCLFEVMDNVFQHSHAQCGYSMLQVHYSSKRCAVAVADDGIGIYQSFREGSVYNAGDEYEAIKFAVQEK